MPRTLRALLFVALLWTPPLARAEPAGNEPAAAPAPAPGADPTLGADPTQYKPDMGWDSGAAAIKMLIALGVVMALIYLTLNFGLRKLMGTRALSFGRGIVSVVERVPLDSKRSLLVVSAAGEYMLIGSGEGGMSLISKLEAAAVEKIKRERVQAPSPLSPFLQKLLARRGAAPPPKDPSKTEPQSPGGAS